MGLPRQLRARFDLEFEAAYLHAMAYALRLSRTLPWVGARQTAVTVAREFVGTAVELTLAYDSRRWDPAQVPLNAFLCGVVRSLLSNARQRVGQARVDALQRPDDVDARADASVARPLGPETFYLSHEACQRIEMDAFALAGDDEGVGKVVRAVVSGLHDVDEIARATGLSAKDVYSARGKLQKRRARRSP